MAWCQKCDLKISRSGRLAVKSWNVAFHLSASAGTISHLGSHNDQPHGELINIHLIPRPNPEYTLRTELAICPPRGGEIAGREADVPGPRPHHNATSHADKRIDIRSRNARYSAEADLALQPLACSVFVASRATVLGWESGEVAGSDEGF